MGEIDDGFRCPIFSSFEPGYCLGENCLFYKVSGNKEYCTYEKYKRKYNKKHETYIKTNVK